VTKTWEKREYE
jgi:hypothetical protein